MMKQIKSQNQLTDRFGQFGRLFILLSLIFLCGQLAFSQNDAQYEIVGRVVDENGKPFVNASVYLEPVHYRSLSFERFIEGKSLETDGKFRFILTKKWVAFERDHFLYVVGDEELDGLSSIRPPYERLYQYDKTFNGRLIKFGDANLIDIGDVRVQFWYGRASLKVSNAIPWPKVYLRIRDRKMHIVYFSSISQADIKNYLKNNESELDVSLPQGKWKVELVSWDGKRVFAHSAYFDIKRNSNRDILMLR